jgi:hypothetical protein
VIEITDMTRTMTDNAGSLIFGEDLDFIRKIRNPISATPEQVHITQNRYQVGDAPPEDRTSEGPSKNNKAAGNTARSLGKGRTIAYELSLLPYPFFG